MARTYHKPKKEKGKGKDRDLRMTRTYHRHPIEEIEGIDTSHGAALRELGITATEDLLMASELDLRKLLSGIAGFPVERIREYRAHATLMQVTGLSGQHAEALYRVRRRSLVKLTAPDPSAVVRELDQAVEDGVIPEGIDIATATRWQKRALVIAHTGAIVGYVKSEESPVEGAKVHCGWEQAVTDASGTFWLPAIPFGEAKLIIRADGYKRLKQELWVLRNPPLTRAEFQLTAGQDEERIVDEGQGEAITTFEADDRIVLRTVALEDLSDGTPLQFRHRYRNGDVRLISVHRKRHGNRIEVPRVVVSGSFVDEGAVRGDVYIWEGGELHKGTETVAEFRERSFLEKLAKHGIEFESSN